MPINTDMDFISELIDDVIERVVEERWLPIAKYEGLYEVSDLGRVRSLARTTTKGGIRSPIKRGEYLLVKLFKNGKGIFNSIQRLVLQAFLPIDEEKFADHINHIRYDNRLENLRWATRNENNRYRKKFDNCSSKYVGVCWHKQVKKWATACRIDNIPNHIGYFNDELEAAKAYNTYIIENGLQKFVVLNNV
jgi:NUMOD4 motif/HNH endonuclease